MLQVLKVATAIPPTLVLRELERYAGEQFFEDGIEKAVQ